jgi:hypothetical protein
MRFAIRVAMLGRLFAVGCMKGLMEGVDATRRS